MYPQIILRTLFRFWKPKVWIKLLDSSPLSIIYHPCEPRANQVPSLGLSFHFSKGDNDSTYLTRVLWVWCEAKYMPRWPCSPVPDTVQSVIYYHCTMLVFVLVPFLWLWHNTWVRLKQRFISLMFWKVGEFKNVAGTSVQPLGAFVLHHSSQKSCKLSGWVWGTWNTSSRSALVRTNPFSLGRN